MAKKKKPAAASTPFYPSAYSYGGSSTSRPKSTHGTSNSGFHPSAYSYGGSSNSGTTNTGFTQGARIGNNQGGYDLPPDLADYVMRAQQAQNTQQPAQNTQPSNPYGPGGGSGNSGGGRRYGGGGGGGSAANNKRVTDLSNQLFNMDVKPFDMMHAGVNTQRQQANAYNPNFAQIAAPYQQQARTDEATRRAQVAQTLKETTGLGQQLAGQNAQAMAGAFRDIQGGGGNVQPYMDRAMQLGAGVTGQLANQTQYQGQLNASGANGLADYLQGSDLIAQGGASNLANNRNVLLNQLTGQDAQIALQQAQAQQALTQAKQEFLLKYMQV